MNEQNKLKHRKKKRQKLFMYENVFFAFCRKSFFFFSRFEKQLFMMFIIIYWFLLRFIYLFADSVVFVPGFIYITAVINTPMVRGPNHTPTFNLMAHGQQPTNQPTNHLMIVIILCYFHSPFPLLILLLPPSNNST